MLRCNVEAYEGDRPYLFVSYSHKDKDRVFPILEQMKQAGFRLWYDQGIESTSEWDVVVADHLHNASAVLFCLSKNFADSTNCKDELIFAKNKIENRIALFLESSLELAVNIELALVRQQQLFLENYRDTSDLVNELKKDKNLQPCLGAATFTHNVMRLNVDRIRRELQDETFLAGKHAYANYDFKQAMDLYRTAYFGGNSIAGTLLANMYYLGHYCPHDYNRAVQIFIDCMYRDNPLAAERLACCYHLGHGVPKNEEKARALFAGCSDALEEMAIFGSEDAQFALAYNLLYGFFSAPIPERGLYWMKKLSAGGSSIAGYHLAMARLTGDNCTKDIDSGLRELNRCIEDPNCAYLFAILLQKGINGRKPNEKKAFDLILYAAQKGLIAAQRDLGNCYYEGKGTPVDFVEALHWYQKAANNEDTYSIGHLGLQYLLAEGTNQDIKKAISFFKQADKKDDAYGARMLGYIYCGLYDRDCSYKDLPKAVLCLQRSADRGDKPALETLLQCYRGDFGKEVQNLPKYCTLLQEAADQGDMDAIEKLLDCYCGELGKELQNMPMYYRTVKKAADLGDAFYKYLLGRILVEGEGEPTLPKDPASGNTLIDEAIQHNNLHAMLYKAERILSEETPQKKDAVSILKKMKLAMLQDNIHEKDLSARFLRRFGHVYRSLALPNFSKGDFSIVSANDLTNEQQYYFKNAYHYFSLSLQKDDTSHDVLYWVAFLQLLYGFKGGTYDDDALLSRLKEKSSTNPNFAFLLGLYYASHGDDDTAVHWYKLAAQSSRTSAYNFTSYCIDHSTHITDALEVLEPWEDLQDPTAAYLMGRIYRNGIGVPRDRAKAKALLRKAADLGSKEAAAELRTFWF